MCIFFLSDSICSLTSQLVVVFTRTLQWSCHNLVSKVYTYASCSTACYAMHCCALQEELGVVVHVKMRRGCDLDGSENKEQEKSWYIFIFLLTLLPNNSFINNSILSPLLFSSLNMIFRFSFVRAWEFSRFCMIFHHFPGVKFFCVKVRWVWLSWKGFLDAISNWEIHI